MTTYRIPSTSTISDLSLPGDLRHEMLRPGDDSTEVDVWSVSGRYLSRWSSGRGSVTDGSDSQWGDWGTRDDEDGLPERVLWLDDGGWADEDGHVHEGT